MEADSQRQGKIFTHVVSKNRVEVVLHTNNCRIEGGFYLKQDERFSDALNDSLQFLSVVDATVLFDDLVMPRVKTPFISVNRDQIDWIYIREEIDEENAE